MNTREQCWIVLLYALIELDGEAAKHEVLSHIQTHNYWCTNDTNDHHRISRPNEYAWRNDFSYGRQHMVANGYIEKPERGIWRITKSGRQYFHTLKSKALGLSSLADMRFTQTFFEQLEEKPIPATEEDADQELIDQLTSFDDSSHEDMQSDAVQLDHTPKPKGNHYRCAAGKYIYKRDANISRRALLLAGYLCEIDRSHPSFQRRNSQHHYMEPHHLIPMSATDQFDVSLDREQNIFCLCSNCHNQIHYGTRNDVRAMLNVLFLAREQEICSILGRKITLEEIYTMYKV